MIDIGERLSAVAKRRRLNDNLNNVSPSSTPVSTATAPIPAAQPLVKPQRPVTAPHIDSSSQIARSSVDEHDQNDFSILVSEGLVSYPPDHRIRSISARKADIQISRSESCLISGKFSLWIKDGVIQLAGAALHPSALTYDVDHSGIDEIPAIVCLTASAEFEIEFNNCIGCIPLKTCLIAKEVISPQSIEASVSFFVDGIHVVHPSSISPAMSRRKVLELDLVNWASKEAQDFQPTTISPGPCFLLCGQRSSDGPIQGLGIVNALLTARDSHGHARYPHGVLLYELDTVCPLFGLPGMATLTHLSMPFFGPACFMSHDPGARSHRILRMQLLDFPTIMTEDEDLFNLLSAPIKARKSGFKKCPVVVIAWDLFDRHDDNMVNEIYQRIRPTHVSCLGETTSASSRFSQLLADAFGLSLKLVPNFSLAGRATPKERDKRLHAYFGAGDNHVSSTNAGVLHAFPQLPRISLSYSQRPQGNFVVALHVNASTDPFCDIVSMLLDNMAAILVEPNTIRARFKQPSVQVGESLTVASSEMPGTSRPSTRIQQFHSRLGELPLVFHAEGTGIECLHEMECIGLGVIDAIDPERQTINLSTPVSPLVFHRHRKAGDKIQLVVQQMIARKWAAAGRR